MHVVKELMGHSSIATTQEYYLQVDEDQEMKAATSIQKLIESADASSESEKSDAQVTPGVKSRQIGGCA